MVKPQSDWPTHEELPGQGFWSGIGIVILFLVVTFGGIALVMLLPGEKPIEEAPTSQSR